MKLVSTLFSILGAALILPLALATPISPDVGAGAGPLERVPTTNAERFARGLPPLSPSKARKHGTPTRRDTTSPVPLSTYQGYIAVYQGGNLQGYLAKQSNGWYSEYTYDSTKKLVISFSLATGQSSGSGINLQLENEPQSVIQSTSYLGLASVDSWTSQYQYSEAFFTSTVMTSGGPSGGLNGLGWLHIESNIWSVNVLTGDLIPSWTTASGAINSDLWVYTQLFIGDGSNYANIEDGAARGNLKFVPQ